MKYPQITSRQNPRVKEAVKLRQGRHRAKARQLIIDGLREIGRALDAGIQPLEAFLCTACSSGARQLAGRLQAEGAQVAEVPPEVYEKLAFGDRSDGLVVVARTPERSLANLRLPPNALVAVLEGLEKPGNVGAILRTADGAGLDAVIVADPQTDLFNPNTIRASVGTVFAKNVCVASVAETLELLKGQLPIVATRPDAQQDYTAIDYRSGAAILLGNEAAGLTDFWQQALVTDVRIPMQGIADSLNVSTSAAILFYEARRQRNGGNRPLAGTPLGSG